MINGLQWLFAAVVATSFVTSIARAEDTSRSFHTGNDLYSVCASLDGSDQIACIAYITGASDAFEISDIEITMILVHEHSGDVSAFASALKTAQTHSVMACPPNTVTREQVRNVVINYLRDHPADRHFKAAVLVGQALHEAWPCNP